MVQNTESENWVESIYPIKTKETKRIPAGFLIDNKYILKASELSSERLLFVHSALLHLKNKGFANCESFIETTEGLPFTKIDGKNFVLLPFHPESGFSFEISEELGEATELMAKMHLSGSGFTVQRATAMMEKFQHPYTVKCYLGDAIKTFRKRTNELNKFRKIAAGSVAEFDLNYARIAEEYCMLAESLTSQLEASLYCKMSADAQEKGCLCHRDFTGHNMVKRSPLPLVINFEEAAIELPVYDLASLLRRRLRKCDWSITEAEFILNKYGKIRPVSYEEFRVLKILLQFPQKLWRITNKYYNSKRSRYEKTALSKLDEILQEQEPLAKLIKEL